MSLSNSFLAGGFLTNVCHPLPQMCQFRIGYVSKDTRGTDRRSCRSIRKIAEARQFSQKLTDEVVSSYLIEPEANRFGVINAFTNAAQKLGPLQRIDMERFAGTLLEAPLN